MANRMGRPRKSAPKRKTLLTYEEMCDRQSDQDVITVMYDGIEKRGHWYEDHMLKMFSECKLVQLTKDVYQVAEWPEKGE